MRAKEPTSESKDPCPSHAKAPFPPSSLVFLCPYAFPSTSHKRKESNNISVCVSPLPPSRPDDPPRSHHLTSFSPSPLLPSPSSTSTSTSKPKYITPFPPPSSLSRKPSHPSTSPPPATGPAPSPSPAAGYHTSPSCSNRGACVTFLV